MSPMKVSDVEPRAFLSARAYGKMVMHAMKHPQNSVCGVLVGRMQSGRKPQNNSTNDEYEQRRAVCIDAIPLLHTHMLHSQLKLGFELVEELCSLTSAYSNSSSSDNGETTIRGNDGIFLKHAESSAIRQTTINGSSHSKADMRIMAFYYCDAIPSPNVNPELSKEAQLIANTVHQQYPDVMLFLLHMPLLGTSINVARFYEFSGASWQEVDPQPVYCSNAALELANVCIADASYLSLADLDDHLCAGDVSPLNVSIFVGHHDLVNEDVDALKVAGVDISQDEMLSFEWKCASEHASHV